MYQKSHHNKKKNWFAEYQKELFMEKAQSQELKKTEAVTDQIVKTWDHTFCLFKMSYQLPILVKLGQYQT